VTLDGFGKPDLAPIIVNLKPENIDAWLNPDPKNPRA
jgi:hypothetical protein